MSNQYSLMTEDELKKIAMQKTKRGSFTKTAIRAQQELWNRNYWAMKNDLYYKNIIKESYEDLLIEDMQYEGNE